MTLMKGMIIDSILCLAREKTAIASGTIPKLRLFQKAFDGDRLLLIADMRFASIT